MWIIAAIILVLIWGGLSLFLHVTFWAVHLILVIALISFVLHFFFGQKKV